MAAGSPIKGINYDQYAAKNADEQGSMYACDCGQEYMNEETFKRHQQTNCKNRSVTCSFCQETYPTSAELRDHLLSCGNKTDQCPNCRQLIRRSHFAYHYENNCAPIDEVETPPLRPKSRSSQRVPPNSNKPVAREDIPSDDYSENYPGQNFSMYPARGNGRIKSPVSNPRNSPRIIECEFCRNQCAQDDYKTHRNNCLQNPININHRPQPSRLPLKPNQNASNGIVHIPCEICNQPVDLPNWSKHVQNCREREAQRLANRAQSMSKEPVTDQLPCEYCHQLFVAKQLRPHETNCPKNPENMASAAKLAGPRPGKSVSLPTRSNNNRSRPPLNNVQPPKNPRIVHYQSIDIDRTHAANRPHDNDRLINDKNRNKQPIRRSASGGVLLQPENSPRSVHTYDNELMRSYENIPRPSNGASQRPGSSVDNLRNIEDNRGRKSNASGNRSPHYNDLKHQRHPRSAQGRYEVIDNQPGRPLRKKHKIPLWKSLFGCGSNTGHASD